MLKPIIEYDNEKLFLFIDEYVNNNRMYIGLINKDGELFNDITINLSDAPLRNNTQIFINSDLSFEIKKLLYKTEVFNKISEQRYNMDNYDIARINKNNLKKYIDEYKIKYWETEEDRNQGIGYTYFETFYNFDVAVKEARNQFEDNNYSCVEIIVNDKDSLFCKDNESEEFYINNKKISMFPKEIVDKYIDNWIDHKELPTKDYRIYCKMVAGGYLAVDNSHGECYVEEFDTEKDAQEWLLGKEKVKEEDIKNEK